MSRRDDDARIVSQYLPKNTTLTVMNGHDVWVFTMQTEVRITFKIGIYYDPDERGYAALAIAPEIEGRPRVQPITAYPPPCGSGAS
ncbi:hypothetical protein FACS189488_14410 [Betaproteobacteria bacterium]|nr:hypothetical protein FACS189488_14410 [Betaproteobacteria bacterium]